MRRLAHLLSVTTFMAAPALGEPNPSQFRPPVDAPADESRNASPSSQPSAETRREIAHRCFMTAISLARAGRYAAAKLLFLEAHAAQPHYLVLYNIAQAEVRLGENASAALHLREFLDQAGGAIDDVRRQAVETEIRRLEAADADAKDAATATGAPNWPARQVSPELEGQRPIDVREGKGGGAAPMSRHSTELSTLSPVRTESGDRNRESVEPAAWTYPTVVGGFALVGCAVGAYIWNHERHREWRRQDADLHALKEGLVQRGVLPTTDAALRRQAAENDALLRSIQRFDAVPVVIGAVGAAALGVGFWAAAQSRDRPTWSASFGPSDLELQTTVVW